jgi:hypothetical protein
MATIEVRPAEQKSTLDEKKVREMVLDAYEHRQHADKPSQTNETMFIETSDPSDVVALESKDRDFKILEIRNEESFRLVLNIIKSELFTSFNGIDEVVDHENKHMKKVLEHLKGHEKVKFAYGIVFVALDETRNGFCPHVMFKFEQGCPPLPLDALCEIAKAPGDKKSKNDAKLLERLEIMKKTTSTISTNDFSNIKSEIRI